eukprot:TRINITY_DN4271_c0_g1_i26.p1 TRINITY_DN4271_c0_g1~~TRINITY_DN4271_c0_g1_i26.p1  ORF type:complete len:152 (+),score=9.96 TRINITY_DN4271_c0_g1_i26:270-725(+)
MAARTANPSPPTTRSPREVGPARGIGGRRMTWRGRLANATRGTQTTSMTSEFAWRCIAWACPQLPHEENDGSLSQPEGNPVAARRMDGHAESTCRSWDLAHERPCIIQWKILKHHYNCCLLYTSDAADEEDSVDLGGRRIIKKKKKRKTEK